MILIVCVDDNKGMMFNHRRQSQDRVQIKSKDSSKPKRLQVRIYIKGQKEKPIKAFSSYDRTDLDHKANQWLAEQGYQTYQQSAGASFRWEV